MGVNRIFPHTAHHGDNSQPAGKKKPSSPSKGLNSLMETIRNQQEHERRLLFLVANNKAFGLDQVLEELPDDLFDEIIFVDAGCSEKIRRQAEDLDLQIISAHCGHQPGLIRKLCFDIAQRESAQMLVLFELQHIRDLSALPAIVRLIDQEIWDVILGTRFDDFLPMSKRSQTTPHQLGPRRGKQLIADIFYGQRLIDPDTDFIACRVHPLWVLPYHENKDSRIFSWQFIAQTLGAGFRIGELPLRVARSEDEIDIYSQIGFSDRWACFKTVAKSWLKRFRIWRKVSEPVNPQMFPPDPPHASA